MEKFVEQTFLFDFYGELLTERQRQVYSSVVLEDYSLSEVAEELEIRHEKSILAGFIKYLPLACMDYIVPRFTVSRSRCTISRELLRFGWLSSDSVKCKDLSCI